MVIFIPWVPRIRKKKKNKKSQETREPELAGARPRQDHLQGPQAPEGFGGPPDLGVCLSFGFMFYNHKLGYPPSQDAIVAK